VQKVSTFWTELFSLLHFFNALYSWVKVFHPVLVINLMAQSLALILHYLTMEIKLEAFTRQIKSRGGTRDED